MISGTGDLPRRQLTQIRALLPDDDEYIKFRDRRLTGYESGDS